MWRSARRLLLGRVLIVLGLSFLVYLYVELTTPDLITLLGNLSQQEADALRRYHGLDEPLPVRYLRFVANVLREDCGWSRAGYPADRLIDPCIPYTVASALAAALVVAITKASRGRALLGFVVMLGLTTGMEALFGWPGLINLAVRSATTPDPTVLRASVLVAGVICTGIDSLVSYGAQRIQKARGVVPSR